MSEAGAAEPDSMMNRIGVGLALSQRGERAAARAHFALLWNEIGRADGDALAQCALAHSMADVQDDVREELHWDLLALAAAGQVTDEQAARAGVPSSVAAFFPSLHLNLGECYRRLGDNELAREHFELGQAAVQALGDDGYGQMIRGGLDRLGQRLAAT